MYRTLKIVILSIGTVLVDSAVRSSEPDQQTKDICCKELYVLVNPGGKKPTTQPEKDLLQDLREWGEIVALREKLQQAQRLLDDDRYDPRERTLVSTLTATMFHAEGETWDELRRESAAMRELIEQRPTKRDKVEEFSSKLKDRLRVLQKPVYARLQVQPPIVADDPEANAAQKEFLKAVQQKMKELFDDSESLTEAERHLILSLRRFEGKRCSANRAAFWLSGYRKGVEA